MGDSVLHKDKKSLRLTQPIVGFREVTQSPLKSRAQMGGEGIWESPDF